jgi:hypothetical protein
MDYSAGDFSLESLDECERTRDQSADDFSIEAIDEADITSKIPYAEVGF